RARNGFHGDRSYSFARRSRVRNTLCQLNTVVSQANAARVSAGSLYSSSMRVFGSTVRLGRRAYRIVRGTTIARGHEDIREMFRMNQDGRITSSGGTAGTRSHSIAPTSAR